jgi:hypothetical protein
MMLRHSLSLKATVHVRSSDDHHHHVFGDVKKLNQRRLTGGEFATVLLDGLAAVAKQARPAVADLRHGCSPRLHCIATIQGWARRLMAWEDRAVTVA